ncbi:peptidoglycan-binding protein [Marinobacter daepoensis]|uniref:Peptidoglycan-binding protein n=1 Tax=Marinobacter daepoensis TaxID=262077 RepID=A0ABS3BIA9_9GAMM|nr:peptidoglycan-binding domain-containing protein [Marinobacter daepoensis]MBN7771564.1 peptidoglycan-binding protein [Marinobacter daepoensis]MBY6034169.1 peptidoglycan-binding protein [Marinobacter daepoensis]MBY6080164.1 peptidoglycan-binding protein [Marinobacter daepoensis]
MKTVTRQMGRTVLAVGTVALLGLPLAAQANEVIALKHALYGAGYNVTNVRPGMDDTTRAELARFQKEHGLEATGILDSETEKALGMISVQQAAQNTGQSTTPAAPAESAPAQAGSAAQETIEEDEDGGWSLW